MKKRIAVLETSALLATLSLFTDHYTHDPEALEKLTQKSPRTGKSALDALYIPDHVIYELTGILPISFPYMLRQFELHKDNPNALKQTIDMYALASPRGEVNDPMGNQKSHVRMLLHYIARHPDCIIRTAASEAYCRRLKADFSILSTSTPHTSQQYRPIFSDVINILGMDMHIEPLRIHTGQLMMMGIISEKEFNDRMGRVETALSRQQRFYKTDELIKKLESSGIINDDLAGHIKRSTPKNTSYATLGLLQKFPQILRLAAQRFDPPTPRAVTSTPLSDDALFYTAIGPSPLLIEHYLYSGIIPNTPTTLRIIAASLGFNITSSQGQNDSEALRDIFYHQGLYEVSPTAEQLNDISKALNAASIEAPLLSRLCASINTREQARHEEFRTACRNPQSEGLAQQSELKIPHIGTAYEKVYGDALINGALSWPEFLSLVKASNGLPRRYDDYIGSHSADILLKPSNNPEEATIALAQEGFVGRTGKTTLNTYISGASRTLPINNTQRAYDILSVRDALNRCRAGMTDRRVSSKLYRSFETMLYPAITRDSAAFRDIAVAQLGEDKVVQLEKDFSNRHARKSLQVQPPYKSLFAAMHTNSRILRKNLGEVATMQAAATVLESNKDADVWIANHDSDVFCDANRNIVLEDSVVRQHAGLDKAIVTLNAHVQGNYHLHMVNTNQWLDTVHTLLGRPARKTYPEVSAKPFIANHRSKSWEEIVHRTSQTITQR